MSCKKFTSDLSAWDVSGVTSFSNLFFGCLEFESDLNQWNVSNVTSLNSTFRRTYKFTSDLSSWDVTKVTDMRATFLDARAFNGDVSTWDMSSVTNAEGMFELAIAFDQDVSLWNVSSATNLIEMFRGARSFDQNLANWTLSSVQDSLGRMLDGTALSVDNYEGTLNGWAANAATPDSIILENFLSYCDDSGRNILLDNGWVIRFDKLDEEDCPITSTNDQLNSALEIFPNPATNQLSITTDLQKEAMVQLIEASGRVVSELKILPGDNIFDLSLLDSGLYFLKIDGSSQTYRFVKVE